MNMEISPNTQAILLLTAPLIAGKKAGEAPLLSLADYNRFARCLREAGKQPADLLGSEGGALLDACGARFGRERLETLLARGFLLSQAVDQWHSRGIWVLSRADAGYPRRLKTRLREEAPPILYGCGQTDVLDAGRWQLSDRGTWMTNSSATRSGSVPWRRRLESRSFPVGPAGSTAPQCLEPWMPGAR